ncbi:hypothetical protein PC120_g21482 [Phytophthora cactorum]|nr:hypothetical protein PC120_g21482 [Phytophthora cactorum]
MVLVDVARANGFLTRKLVVNLSADRGPHRNYMVQLIAELFTGKWKEAPSEGVMRFTDTRPTNAASPQPPMSAVWSVGSSGVDGVAGSP